MYARVFSAFRSSVMRSESHTPGQLPMFADNINGDPFTITRKDHIDGRTAKSFAKD